MTAHTTPTPVTPQALALSTLDAIEDANEALAPCRAVTALANVAQLESEQEMPTLNRADLAALLELLTDNMARRIDRARTIAEGLCNGARAH
jgi:hypothetical protein